MSDSGGAAHQCNVQSFDFGPWTLTVTKSHIMPSACSKPDVCATVDETDNGYLCNFCRFSRQLTIPVLPEMCFADNCLRIQHTAGHGIEFNTLDSLRPVKSSVDLLVACAEQWKCSRSDVPGVNSVSKPFDWTFSTDYRGTLLGKHAPLVITPTDQRIDMERLREREKIMFFSELVLFEDELADNGCALCSVKVRVMARSFFLLLRFYLRVDNVLVRVCDTRVYYEAGQQFLLREFSIRESPVHKLQVPTSVLIDPNQVWAHLPVTESVCEKLNFPAPPK